MVAALVLLCSSALVFASGRAEKGADASTPQAADASTTQTNPQALADASKNLETIQLSFREVAKKVLPVVVEVDVSESVTRADTDAEPV